MNSTNSSKIVLLKDQDWNMIDGQICRIVNFTSLVSIKDGEILTPDNSTPYASVTLECEKLPKNITGYITHKIDFMHLWSAFKERGINKNEEVILIYTTKNYKNLFIKLLLPTLPKLIVWICKKGAFKLITDSSYKPKLHGEARFLAERPIIELKPDVME